MNRAINKFKPSNVNPEVIKDKKPDWLRVRLTNSDTSHNLKKILKESDLVTVCQEAACPNICECFGKGTATFMIMGDTCTRKCAFCNVAYGKPKSLDKNEPIKIAEVVHKMGLKYVVITSVTRDDIKDGGASHFVNCIKEIRKKNQIIKIEILVPDFMRKLEVALSTLANNLPDVFNHNMETTEIFYKTIRKSADYNWSLNLLKTFKKRFSNVLTKSGIMLGLGESETEVKKTIQDIREANADMLTIGQYLQPTQYHAPVKRYIHPDEFKKLKQFALDLGFKGVASGPMVRSSYLADEQSVSFLN